MELNKIYNENCLDTMKRMPDNFVDLTVTSPPYDKLRNYNGFEFKFEEIAKELFRVTKIGGVVVWVVGDQTVNGSETGTSFKQALFFMSIGFNLHDTMIYEKSNFANPSNNRYHQIFEYMFILTKGQVKIFNPIKDKKNKHIGEREKSPNRNKNGVLVQDRGRNIINNFGQRVNIWKYNTGGCNNSKDESSFNHPGTFPEKLAADHIYTWSNEGATIYDPFSGSGTTAKMAHLQKRNWIGSEISEEYVKLSYKRLEKYLTQTVLF